MRVLIIEDDLDLCGLMQDNLAAVGYRVDTCNDGLDGLIYIKENLYDVVLLDRMLPGLDGISVLRQARLDGVTTPVILITALGATEHIVEGLDVGADDYIVKPFAVDVLLARVRAVSRRPAEIADDDIIEVGGVQLFPNKKLLAGGQAQRTLSQRECALLEMFMRNPGKTLSRDAIYSYVWGLDNIVEDASIDSYIHFVRARLAEIDAPLSIVTQRGVGYRLESGNV